MLACATRINTFQKKMTGLSCKSSVRLPINGVTTPFTQYKCSQ